MTFTTLIPGVFNTLPSPKCYGEEQIAGKLLVDGQV